MKLQSAVKRIWEAIATPKEDSSQTVKGVQHQVVEAHGATKIDYTPDQHARKYEQGVFESKGESGKWQVKTSGATLGRHVVSKTGTKVSAARSAEVESVRVRREKEKKTSGKDGRQADPWNTVDPPHSWSRGFQQTPDC